jgi:hypothetical protein
MAMQKKGQVQGAQPFRRDEHYAVRRRAGETKRNTEIGLFTKSS